MEKKVAIVMGSDSDLAVMKKCADKLEELAVPYEIRILSAHRTPLAAMNYAQKAKENGFGVIIAAAGKAAGRSPTGRRPKNTGGLPSAEHSGSDDAGCGISGEIEEYL